ncbi:MAG TPA: immunoglobulin domain-containing protein [Thermoanaerobaculia bacterium]|nr:immunoglobulin domain-containing protein [Thermoanaerobaculia bacterium]
MHRSPTALAVILLFLTLALSPPGSATPPALNPGDPQHFLWNGQQWFPTGYTPGLVAIVGINDFSKDPTGTYYKKILADMANSNVRLIRQVFYFGQPGYEGPANDCVTITRTPLTYYQRPGPGAAFDGAAKYDLTKVNQSYIDYFKGFVAEASAKGVVVIVDLFDSYHLNQDIASNFCAGPRGRRYDAYQTNNNINGVIAATRADFFPAVASGSPTSIYFHQKALVRRVVQEMGQFDNIIWEVSNEVPHHFMGIPASPDFTAWKDLMAGEIHQAETDFGKPRHLIMQVDLPDHIKAGGNEDYLVPVPSGVALFRDLFQAHQSWDMPLIKDDDGGTLGTTANGERRLAWGSLTSGAHVTSFAYLTAVLSEWIKQPHVDARKYFGYLTRFVDTLKVNLAGMARRDDLINSGTSGWLYARVGEEYVAYMDGGPVPAGCPQNPDRGLNPTCFPEQERGMWPGVNSYSLIGLPATFTATWYNPRAGTFNPAFVGSGPNATFNLPAAGTDWALHIKAGITPPQVSAPAPNPQSVRVGTTASFSVTVMGPGPLTYRWQYRPASGAFTSLFDGGRFAGTASSTLTITNAQTTDTGFYRCLVSNAGGGGNSGPGSLTVTP